MVPAGVLEKPTIEEPQVKKILNILVRSQFPYDWIGSFWHIGP